MEATQEKKQNPTARMRAFMERLYPICRSITGDGVRQTLAILQEINPLEIFEVPSGEAVFDWTVPKEWNIKDAWIKNGRGEKIVDFQEHSLHILNYSIPIHEKMNWEELKSHIYTLPAQPDLIPYRTSYYSENWGFCMRHKDFELLGEGKYEVFIDSSLDEGSLTYGELFIPGKSEEEVLFSTHICHPSLANDNLSGMLVCSMLAQWLRERENRYSYRFVFIPGTIGAITWLAKNEEKTENIKYGLVAPLLGDEGGFTYKKSRRGDTEIDSMVAHVLKMEGVDHQVREFSPYGYDERQYCSPGFNLAVGNLCRTPYSEFPEYHTSGDNLEFVKDDSLKESLEILKKIVGSLEANQTYINLSPMCEPQLGKRGLYDATGGSSNVKDARMAMLWLLNQCDGTNDLLQISIKSGYSIELLEEVTQILLAKGLLKTV
ncbi:MAG: DUF4910 domain-containing protein [Bacteroidota bacterium]